MLNKVEKKVQDMQSRRTAGMRDLEKVAEEIRSLRKRVQEAGKKYTNEYIAVCQRSLDIYEGIQSA